MPVHRTGFRTAMRNLDHTRVTIAARAVGIAQGALDCGTEYTRRAILIGPQGRPRGVPAPDAWRLRRTAPPPASALLRGTGRDDHGNQRLLALFVNAPSP
jgi:hypothetical protein